MTEHRDLPWRVAAAVLLVVVGVVHLKLYDDGYKDFPNHDLGRSFLLNAVGAALLAVLLVAWHHLVPVVAALALVDGTMLAFTLSRHRGIFGFTETGWDPSPEAAIALFSEIAAAGVLLYLMFLALVEIAPRRRTAARSPV
jgi:hypothetical protein